MQEWGKGALLLHRSIRTDATDEQRGILPKGTAINQSYLGYGVLNWLSPKNSYPKMPAPSAGILGYQRKAGA